MAQPKAIIVEGNGSNGRSEQRRSASGLSLGCNQPIDRTGLIAHNELLLSGWATSPQGISGVVVQIGERTLTATYGLDTPWIAEGMPEMAGADRAGFELRVDTSGWETGEHEVRIVAYDGDGNRSELAGRARILPFEEPAHTQAGMSAAIAAGEVVMWLESPPVVEGTCEIEGRMEVRGWAYAKDGLDGVRVMLDGQSFEALHPIVRPDLLEAFGPDVAAAAGFVLPLDPSECPPGHHKLTVVATGRDGRSIGVGGDVVMLPEPAAEPPQAGEPAAIDWLEDRHLPVLAKEGAERADREAGAASALELEHQLRYRLATGLAKGQVVLDVGCGTGCGSALLAGAGAERVVATDDDEDLLAEARRRTEGQPVEHHCCDPCLLPFDDDSFDLITCFEAIERSTDPDLALEELRRVLSPGGLLLVSTGNRRPRLAEGGSDAWGHTGGELELALRRGFENVRLYRQRISLASTLLEEESPATADGEADLGLDVRRLGAGSGGDVRLVMMASDEPLPEPARMAMLGSPRAVRQLHDTARTWEDRALRAEADAAATRVEVNLARMQQEASAGMLQARTAELALLDEARERLQEQEARVVEQEARVVEQEARLVEQQDQLVEQQGRLEEQEARVVEQEARVVEQQGRLEEQDARIWAQYEQLEQQREQLERQREQIAQRDALLDSQASTLGARNAELRVTGERLRQAEAELATWRDSTSMRVTRPLRAIGNGARRIRGSLSRRRRA